MESSWKRVLNDEFQKSYFTGLAEFVREEYKRAAVYPAACDIFRAFDKTPFEQVKVVILGQDPYHGQGQANGLCFSVNDGVRLPPSLQNIFQEIQREFSRPVPASGNLDRWAEQGVLLLNATMTVRAGEAASHQQKGWETFTDVVVKTLNEKREGLVFLLWGASAQRKGKYIDPERHLVLKSAHPSPLSAHRGFKGNGHFGTTNSYLRKIGKAPVDW